MSALIQAEVINLSRNIIITGNFRMIKSLQQMQNKNRHFNDKIPK